MQSIALVRGSGHIYAEGTTVPIEHGKYFFVTMFVMYYLRFVCVTYYYFELTCLCCSFAHLFSHSMCSTIRCVLPKIKEERRDWKRLLDCYFDIR